MNLLSKDTTATHVLIPTSSDATRSSRYPVSAAVSQVPVLLHFKRPSHVLGAYNYNYPKKQSAHRALPTGTTTLCGASTPSARPQAQYHPARPASCPLLPPSSLPTPPSSTPRRLLAH